MICFRLARIVLTAHALPGPRQRDVRIQRPSEIRFPRRRANLGVSQAIGSDVINVQDSHQVCIRLCSHGIPLSSRIRRYVPTHRRM